MERIGSYELSDQGSNPCRDAKHASLAKWYGNRLLIYVPKVRFLQEVPNMEDWVSGRNQQFAKLSYCQRYRRSESFIFRQNMAGYTVSSSRADCKSVAFGLGWCDSITCHQIT